VGFLVHNREREIERLCERERERERERVSECGSGMERERMG
jgi:hypothetical protein